MSTNATQTDRTKRIETLCSFCMNDVVLKLHRMTVHVKGKVLGTNEISVDSDGLAMWDCPACGHADSFWVDFEREFADWLK